MSSYVVECQINANDDRRFVTVQATSAQQAHVEANRIIRSQIGVDSAVRGCIVVGVYQ